MVPMQWTANVKIPCYGWFGRDDFASEQEARNYVARMLRTARKNRPLARPRYSSRTYYIRPHLMLVTDAD